MGVFLPSLVIALTEVKLLAKMLLINWPLLDSADMYVKDCNSLLICPLFVELKCVCRM